jgi:hypothetical protein
MKLIKSKKGIALLTMLVVAAVAAFGAYAYWTTTGAGSGSAQNASTNGTLVLHASFAPGLTPGASEAVSYSADNGNSSSLQVGTVHAVVSVSNAYDATTNPSGCKASDFTVADVAENQTIPANTTSSVALAHDGLITFADTAANQDGCKGATVTLTLSS